MLEFLILALMSQKAQEFLHQQNTNQVLPSIEILQPSALPEKDAGRIAPKLLEDPATSIFAMDLDSSKVLLEKKSNRSQPIASLSKLMTVLIILENHALDEVVTVPLEATQINSSTIDIYQYEQLTVQTLLEAALIGSANDAALALAIFHSGSEEAFIKEMNQMAQKLGLSSAKFWNATGLDVIQDSKSTSAVDMEENLQKQSSIPALLVQKKAKIFGNQMSARDVAKLARLLLEYNFVRETVQKNHFYGTSVDGKFFHEKPTTNQLLGNFLNLKGFKTGYTLLAGECFVALGETSDGHEVLTVILGSSDRFGETKKLLSWIYDSFEWR